MPDRKKGKGEKLCQHMISLSHEFNQGAVTRTRTRKRRPYLIILNYEKDSLTFSFSVFLKEITSQLLCFFTILRNQLFSTKNKVRTREKLPTRSPLPPQGSWNGRLHSILQRKLSIKNRPKRGQKQPPFWIVIRRGAVIFIRLSRSTPPINDRSDGRYGVM